jgi:hypothetical protein
MSIGGISSSSYTSQTSSSDTNSGNDPIAQLLKAIRSGNLTAAKAAYANVLDHAPGGSASSSSSSSSSSSGNSSSGNPLQQLLSQLGTALQSGDITTAQSLVKSFEANKPSGSAPPPPPPDGGSSGDQALGSAVGSLFSSVQSGDLSSAQSAYSSLESLLDGDGSSSSASTSSSTGSSSTGSTNPLLQLIQSLGTSLDDGDIQGAQSTLSSFAQNAQSGLTYNTTA